MYGWIAQIAFVVLMVIGWAFGELGPRAAGVVVALWCAAVVTTHLVPALPLSSLVALLDIVLVFIIFNGDVRIR